jgi:penicillin-insensitive murein endopeptidase
VADPDVRVTRIFVSPRVRDWLLAYARAAEAPPDDIARVQSVLSTARDTGTHQDHMHVRIACSADDIAHGRCSDEPAVPPRRRRRGRRPKPRKWFAHVRCALPRDAVASDQPRGGSHPVRARPASER